MMIRKYISPPNHYCLSTYAPIRVILHGIYTRNLRKISCVDPIYARKVA